MPGDEACKARSGEWGQQLSKREKKEERERGEKNDTIFEISTKRRHTAGCLGPESTRSLSLPAEPKSARYNGIGTFAEDTAWRMFPGVVLLEWGRFM